MLLANVGFCPRAQRPCESILCTLTASPSCSDCRVQTPAAHPFLRTQLWRGHPIARSRRISSRKRLVVQSAVSPAAVFGAMTVCVTPVYALMLSRPSALMTRQLVRYRWTFALASAAYAAALLSWAPSNIQSVASHAITGLATNERASWLAGLLAVPRVTTLAWMHLLLLDLFQARWVYLDAQQSRVAASHSVILCFMFGPLGLLSHVLTKRLSGLRRNPQVRQGAQ